MQPGEVREAVKKKLVDKIIDQMADELLKEFKSEDISFNEKCQLVVNYINKIGA